MIPLKGNILIIDDNPDILFTLKILLRPLGSKLLTTTDPREINRLLTIQSVDVVLLDMNFTEDAVSGKEGFYWLNRIREISPETVVILITAYADMEKAIRAIKGGATDFIAKPWDNQKLIATVSAALELSLQKKETNTIKQERDTLAKPSPVLHTELIGNSSVMDKIRKMIEKISKTDANVLITGENGTGKDLVAQLIYEQSSRQENSFITVDLGSIPETLFESELFGYVKGAFTDARSEKPGRLEIADGGTLFLNEIGNLSPHLQSRLLSVLEKREVQRLGSTTSKPLDIRLISATNTHLYKAVENGDFRMDLLYRLNTIELNIPPLRERGNDIFLLANHFLCQQSEKYKKKITGLSSETKEMFRTYTWPGNVRELQHTIERAVILTTHTELQPEDVAFSVKRKTILSSEKEYNLETIEKATILEALDTCKGNLSKAAALLGITRTSLYRRLEKHNL